MERRALIAVVLSLLILILYQEVVIKQFYPPVDSSQRPTPDDATRSESPPPLREASQPPPVKEPEAPAGEPVVALGRDVVVETDLYRAVFTTAGGRLKHLELKQYRTTIEPDSPPLELVTQSDLAELPLGLQLRGEETLNDRATTYTVDRDDVSVSGDQTATLTFTGRLGSTQVTKRLVVQANSYLFGVDVRVEGLDDRVNQMAIAWNGHVSEAGEAGMMQPGAASDVVFHSAVALQGSKLRKESFSGLEEDVTHKGDIAWVALSGQYFLAALIPDVEPTNDLWAWMRRHEASEQTGGESAVPWIETELLFPAGTFSAHLDLYLGPKDLSLLEQSGHSLERAVDLGWFTIVARPMLQVLKLSHTVTGNYGVDIIIMTVLIKVLFFPLTQKSMKSMREMQKLQPQMTALRERYKDKPEQMNKEIMELYRRHKVNPLGGCLPMVLQIPVFIGLYQALLNAVELRHAPFVAWINDLSAPDRLGSFQLPFVDQPGFPVLTLLMGASMFLQQWMTPVAGDPTQQRVMLIMPVIFTFMFINFPAGLTLYWLVNNILTIAQQYALNRPER
jgi:YidC/Oxa1 family membrane protein insertase